jgi:hypothetical protein
MISGNDMFNYRNPHHLPGFLHDPGDFDILIRKCTITRWLWAIAKALAPANKSRMNTSRGWRNEALPLPCDTSKTPSGLPLFVKATK